MQHSAKQILKQVGLGGVVDHTYSSMSSGERVRCLIARAMVTCPRLLILDEPTAGLDLLAREQVLATVQRVMGMAEAPTVVLITHHVEELPPITSNVLLMDNGRPAAQGSMAEVLRPEILSRVYGVPVVVRISDGRYYLELTPTAWTIWPVGDENGRNSLRIGA